MIIRKKILIAFISVLFIFAVFFFYSNNVSASGPCLSGRGGYCAQLAAVIPGLEFIQYDESQGLGGFIASLYVFGLGIVGISAMAMLVYSAFLYMTARDNMNQVGNARKKISNALLGLTLAFLSWIILRTINPDLVKSLDVKITPIENIVVGEGGAAMSVGTTCFVANNNCPPPLACLPTGNSTIVGSCQFPPENVSSKQPGSVMVGRTCENTAQCQSGLTCNKVAGSPYPGICVDVNNQIVKPGEIPYGGICVKGKDVCAKAGKATQPICKPLNPLTSETRCL